MQLLKAAHQKQDCPLHPKVSHWRSNQHRPQIIAQLAALSTALLPLQFLVLTSQIKTVIMSNSGTGSSLASAFSATISPFSVTANATVLYIFDSGASGHMTSDDSVLTQTDSPSSSQFIYTASHLPVIKISSITSGLLSISSILFVSNLSANHVCDN